MQGEILVAAPYDANGVGLEHDNTDECYQDHDGKGLRAQLEQFVAPRQFLVFQQLMDLSQVGEEISCGQTVGQRQEKCC